MLFATVELLTGWHPELQPQVMESVCAFGSSGGPPAEAAPGSILWDILALLLLRLCKYMLSLDFAVQALRVTNSNHSKRKG